MADRDAPDSLPRARYLGSPEYPAAERIAPVLFCVEQGCMVLLHGFMKKTQKTPKQDIDLAIKCRRGEGA
jgi:hypothetical protein